ncbi:MAG: ParB/RepB/Spo0J family partition protein [bacterium]|nr:ParB/RepB/Spo0J family partition protein [bacterium]
MISDMQGGGLESLIPKKSYNGGDNDINDDTRQEIEFRLPDISGGQKAAAPREVGDHVPTEVVAQPGSLRQEKTSENIFQIEVERISPNPHQPRRDFNEDSLRELAGSIREFGILQPLVVTKVEEETDLGSRVSYELIAGERRLKAAKILGLPTVPVIIRRPTKEAEKLELAVIENIQRADLNPIESARAMARLQDEFSMTQREIAARLGKSREAISNTVRLLSLPSEIQKAIAEGNVSESQGRMLLSLDDIGMQSTIFGEILKDNLTIRQLEKRIRRAKGQPDKDVEKSGEGVPDLEAEALKNQLEEFLGTKVEVLRDGKSGKIVINFYSQEELNAVLSKFFRQNGSQSF